MRLDRLAPLWRLAPAAAAAIYAWLAAVTGFQELLAVAAVLLLLAAIHILRGLCRPTTIEGAGVTLLALSAAGLAALPPLAGMITPGLCTDMTITYEIALGIFVYSAMAVIALTLSKRLSGPGAPSLPRRRARKLLWLLPAGLMLLAVPPLPLVHEGACTPGSRIAALLPIATLFPIGLAIFFGNLARRAPR